MWRIKSRIAILLCMILCWKTGLTGDFCEYFEPTVSGWEKQAGVRELHKVATISDFETTGNWSLVAFSSSSFVACARCIIVCSDYIIASARPGQSSSAKSPKIPRSSRTGYYSHVLRITSMYTYTRILYRMHTICIIQAPWYYFRIFKAQYAIDQSSNIVPALFFATHLRILNIY